MHGSSGHAGIKVPRKSAGAEKYLSFSEVIYEIRLNEIIICSAVFTDAKASQAGRG
jgi:hypothetical protein